jgi:hypothetical protein
MLAYGPARIVDEAPLPGVPRAVDFFVTNLGWVLEDEGAEGELHSWKVVRTGAAARSSGRSRTSSISDAARQPAKPAACSASTASRPPRRA